MSLRNTPWMLLATLLAFQVLISCAPAGPAPGTSAFYWQKANEYFAAGDYQKAREQLESLTDDAEYSARALPWAVALDYALAAGYMDLADAYEAGVRENKDNPAPLRRPMLLHRSSANHMTLQFAESLAKLQRTSGDSVALAFPFPKGSSGESPQVERVRKGATTLTAVETATVEKRAFERRMLMAACEIAGAPDDPAKAQQVFAGQDAKVPRATFQYAMANALFSLSKMYVKGKLYDLEKLNLLCQRAHEALKNVPASEQSKLLDEKIQLAIKDAGKV